LLREYLLSVFAAAILCCMAMSITGKKGLVGSVVQIITALIMTAVLIKPLRNLQLPNLSQFSWQSIGQEAADAGAESAQREILEAIEEKTVLCIQNRPPSMARLWMFVWSWIKCFPNAWCWWEQFLLMRKIPSAVG